jgi:hypothetical protein
MNSPYLSRKFLLTIASMIVTGVLVWFEKIDSGAFVTVYVATVGAYIAGNVYQNTKVTK